MKKIEFNYKPKESKHKHSFQELAEEMTSYFNKNCYWLFYKFPEGIIRTEFGVCKQDGKDFKYLLYKLNSYK